LPLSDRDYMKPEPPKVRRRLWSSGSSSSGFNLSPVWVLILVNLLVFLVTTFSKSVYVQLGLIPDMVAQKPWTLLTSMFVHYDIWHILFNMVALYFFGRVLLSFVGNTRFLLVYFIGGIIGNAVFLLLNLSSPVILVGASGAVYAIAGSLVIMVPNMRVSLWGIIPMPLWVFAIIFLVILSLPPFSGTNIAWQAHLGGLLVGVIGGLIFRRRMLPPIYYR
jgi:membrane associated rhomboid family serine protease